MRRAVLIAVLCAGAAGALVAATWTTVDRWLDAPLDFQGKVTLHIAPGSAFRDVAAIMEEANQDGGGDEDELTPECQAVEDQCPGITDDDDDMPAGGGDMGGDMGAPEFDS